MQVLLLQADEPAPVRSVFAVSDLHVTCIGGIGLSVVYGAKADSSQPRPSKNCTRRRLAPGTRWDGTSARIRIPAATCCTITVRIVFGTRQCGWHRSAILQF